MDQPTLVARAARLRALHTPGDPLVLPNAWDAASGRAVVAAGFPVVATSSSAVGASLGWGDGEKTPPDEMFAAVWRIARSLDEVAPAAAAAAAAQAAGGPGVPLTADLEGGYGLPPDDFVRRMLEAGAVGCNLEDSDHSGAAVLRDPAEHASYLAAVRAAARAAGVDIVLNARVDVFLRQVGEPTERAGLAVERGKRYLAAGADCIFPFGVREEADITAMIEALDGPLNVILVPGAPPLARLRELGVARVSFGGRLQRATIEELKLQLQSIA